MYNCGYGLDDSIDDVLAMIKDITLKKVVLNKKGKTIHPNRKK
jgi:type II secretory pathway component PulC